MLGECCCCCWLFVQEVEVDVGGLGCFGVLPLRLMGAEEEEEVIRRNGCYRIVFLIVGVKLHEKCRCHYDLGDVVSVGRFFAMSRQLYRRLSGASPCPSPHMFSDTCN